MKYLYLNHDTFRFKRRVPKDLVALIGRDLVDEQLTGIKDRREAEREVTRLTALTDAEFKKARALIADASSIRQAVLELVNGDSPKAPHRALTAVSLAVRQAAAKSLMIPPTTGSPSLRDVEVLTPMHLKGLQEIVEETRRGLQKAFLQEDAKRLSATGQMPGDDPSEAAARRKILGAFEADAHALARMSGDATELRQDDGLRSVLSRWEKEASPKAKSVNEFHSMVRRFEEIVGDLRVGEITRRHVLDFKDKLLDTPSKKGGGLLSATTVKKEIGLLRALLNVAVDSDLIEANPALRVRIAKGAEAKSGRRPPYSREQLRRLVAELVPLTKSADEVDRKRAWFALTVLFSGARRGEMAGLMPGEVDTIDRVAVFDLPRERVKNKASVRRIPIHETLLQLGFLEFVRSAPKDRPLFHYGSVKHLDDTLGKWFSDFVPSIGITDGGRVLHAFRHDMKDALREAKVDKELRDRLQGHSAGDVAATYGAGDGLKRARDAINSVYRDLWASTAAPTVA